jgi:hypothetical protein
MYLGAFARRRHGCRRLRAGDRKPFVEWSQIFPDVDNRRLDLTERDACVEAVRTRPIRRLVNYARRVGCQYHWTSYYARHHMHFFRAAGLPNVFWMPGSIHGPVHPDSTRRVVTYPAVLRARRSSSA